jgi:PAS domain S-box-containing protein
MTGRSAPSAWQAARAALRWLTEPHPAITDPEDRARMRVLSALLLAATLVSGVGFVILSTGQGSGQYRQEFLINSIPLAAGYLLSRTRYHQVMSALACILPAAGVFGVVLSMPQRDPTYVNYALMWLFAPILFAGLTLSVKQTALFAGLVLAGLAALIELLPELSGAANGMIFGFLLTVSAMTLVLAAVHQQNLARLKEELGERIRAEGALAASEKRWRSVAQTAADAIIILDSQKHITSWNDAAQAMFGYTEQAIASEPMTTLIPPEQAHLCPEMMRKMLQRQGERRSGPQVRVELVRKDRSRFPAELTASQWELNGETYCTCILRDVSERYQIEARLRTSLAEKEVMLKEIHHRVKNNLQVISSLFSLQSSSLTDETANALLTESRMRVRSMALIHEKLYQSSDLSRIDFAEYIHGLVRYLIPAYEPANQVTFHIQAEEVRLSLNCAVPCGLIVNELVSNALKHAFPDGRPGTVKVSASGDGDQIRLIVADDGVGLPAGQDVLEGDTLGLQLVQSLVGQLEGSLTLSGEQGTRCEITFCDSSPETPEPDRPGEAASGQPEKTS